VVQNLEPQARGKNFEKIIGLMLSNENIRHSLAYRPQGEEIDGAFIWNAHTFLIEAKWHKDPMSASDIYAFKGKVDGKFSGTRGVFISMSGYSDDCLKALSYGKELNILLFDQDDIKDIVGNQNEEGMDFTKVLTEKLFAASQTGNVYLTWRNLLQSQKTENKSLLIYCYSPDEIVVKSLMDYVSNHDHLMTEIVNLSSIQGSVKGTLSLIQLGLANAPDNGTILIIVSADRIDDENQQILSNAQIHIPLPPSWSYHLITASPNVFSWVGESGIPSGQEIFTVKDNKPSINLQSLALLKRAFDASKNVDWNVLATRNKEIKETLSFIREILPRRPGYM
jgi:Restriction endonuclease